MRSRQPETGSSRAAHVPITWPAKPPPASPSLAAPQQPIPQLRALSAPISGPRRADDLDTQLVRLLDRTLRFDKGFVLYRQTDGTWKLVVVPRGQRFAVTVATEVLRLAQQSTQALWQDAAEPEARLPSVGFPERLIIPLRDRRRGHLLGAAYLTGNRLWPRAAEASRLAMHFARLATEAISQREVRRQRA